MRSSIRRVTFVVLFGLCLSACETAKVAEVPKPSASRVGENKTSAASTAIKPNAETSPAPAPASVPAPKAPEPVAPVVVKPEQLFSEGKELYEKGDYRGAIRKLTSARDAADESPSLKQNSLKFLAFSYCVSNQRALCKTQFSNLLKLQPSFELSRGEAGHPLWGPVFKEAKAGVGKSSK